MKNLKVVVLAILILLIGMFILTGCSSGNGEGMNPTYTEPETIEDEEQAMEELKKNIEKEVMGITQSGDYVIKLKNNNDVPVYVDDVSVRFFDAEGNFVKKENTDYSQASGYLQSSAHLQTAESDCTFLDLKDSNGNVTSQSICNFIENNAKVKTDNSPIYFVGDASMIYQNLLENLNFKNQNKIILAAPRFCEISSISIAKAGYAKYKNGNYGNSSILTPVYLRKSQAELSLEQNR